MKASDSTSADISDVSDDIRITLTMTMWYKEPWVTNKTDKIVEL